jgi:hypothetical protein
MKFKWPVRCYVTTGDFVFWCVASSVIEAWALYLSVPISQKRRTL